MALVVAQAAAAGPLTRHVQSRICPQLLGTRFPAHRGRPKQGGRLRVFGEQEAETVEMGPPGGVRSSGLVLGNGPPVGTGLQQRPGEEAGNPPGLVTPTRSPTPLALSWAAVAFGCAPQRTRSPVGGGLEHAA